MANDTKKVEVPESMLLEMQKALKESQDKIASLEAANIAKDVVEGKKDIRELESLEEKFKTKEYTLRKILLDDGKEHIIIGWTRRGCYEVWDKSGPNAVKALMYDVFFLDKQDKATTITANMFWAGEKIKVYEVSKDIKIVKHKTGEEIQVLDWDDKHGMRVETGVTIDGYYATPEGTITVSIPGYDKPLTLNQMYLNA